MKALCIKDHEKTAGITKINFKKEKFYELLSVKVENGLTICNILRKAVNSTIYILIYENFNEYFIVGEQSIRKYKLEKLKDLTR